MRLEPADDGRVVGRNVRGEDLRAAGRLHATRDEVVLYRPPGTPVSSGRVGTGAVPSPGRGASAADPPRHAREVGVHVRFPRLCPLLVGGNRPRRSRACPGRWHRRSPPPTSARAGGPSPRAASSRVHDGRDEEVRAVFERRLRQHVGAVEAAPRLGHVGPRRARSDRARGRAEPRPRHPARRACARTRARPRGPSPCARAPRP